MLWLEAGTGWLGGCCTFVRMILQQSRGGKKSNNKCLLTTKKERGAQEQRTDNWELHSQAEPCSSWDEQCTEDLGRELGACTRDRLVLTWCLGVTCMSSGGLEPLFWITLYRRRPLSRWSSCLRHTLSDYTSSLLCLMLSFCGTKERHQVTHLPSGTTESPLLPVAHGQKRGEYESLCNRKI